MSSDTIRIEVAYSPPVLSMCGKWVVDNDMHTVLIPRATEHGECERLAAVDQVRRGYHESSTVKSRHYRRGTTHYRAWRGSESSLPD